MKLGFESSEKVTLWEDSGVFKIEVRFFHLNPIGEFKAEINLGEFSNVFNYTGLEAF